MHNVVQPHDHVYILLDDNDPKQGFLGLTTISYQSEFVVKKPHATLQWNPPIADTMGLLLQSGL